MLASKMMAMNMWPDLTRVAKDFEIPREFELRLGARGLDRSRSQNSPQANNP